MVSAGYCPSISAIRFYILGSDDIEKLSSVNIKSYETFVANDTPVPGGLYDPRMGAIVNLYNCVTCGHNHHKCPGHFGYYKTDVPLLQPVVADHVVKWLKIVCLKCGTLLIDHLKVKGKSNREKLQFATTLQTNYKICPECGEKHPKIKTNDDNIFYINLIKEDGVIETMKMQDIWAVLQKISDSTCQRMGVALDCHPRKYYTENIFIPPITIRPNFKSGLINKSHRASPLVEFVRGIIRKGNIKGTEDALDKAHLFMARALYDMIRGGSQKRGEVRKQNIIGGSTSDAILKTIGGKKGRIRNYLMGHRGFNGARITISGNATLKINELGIPDYVVKTLLISEVVRDYNKNKLWDYILDGRCSRIKKISTGKEHNINYTDVSGLVLEYGDIIYRHITKDDYINFNRQPSLKESAIGSHRAVPFDNDEQNTFQINVGVCVNYNADFDGDQMRAKILTSSRSIAEAKYITSVSRWMLSQQIASANNGEVQDAIVGSALLTHSDTKISKLHVMRMFARTGILDINFDKESYTGREILSLLLKRTPISYKGKAAYYKASFKDFIPYKDTDINVVIENGVIKSGIIDKNTIGEGIPNGLFHLIALEYGTNRAIEVIYQYQQIIMEYLYMRGFTMGLDNLIVSKDARTTIDRIINDKILESKAYADKLVRGRVFAPMGTTLQEHYEQTQLKILSFGDNILGPVISSINQTDNGLFQMIMYGSKAKPTHLSEMMAVRGSVTLEGKRMPQIFSPWRCSTYFARFDMDPISRGFVRDPLTEGFNADTMGFSAQSARQMVVQKSQSTSLTGANQRKHIKNMESTMINNLYQTFKSQMLLQFLYGEDGFDPRYLVNQKVDTVFMNDKQIDEIFGTKIKQENKQLKEDRDAFRVMMNILTDTGLQYKGFTDSMSFGIYVDSIIDEYFEDDEIKESLDEKYHIVKDYIDNIHYFYSNKKQKEKKKAMPSFITSVVRTLQTLLRIKLASKHLAYIKKDNIQPMLDNITVKLMRSLIPAGSCVGIQAAQGVGEPLTQAMLDAIHGASSGARAGLESIKEILGGKYAIPESNGMIIRFKDHAIQDKTRVTEISNYIKRVKIEDLYKSWQIFMEDFGDPVHPSYKHEKDIINKQAKDLQNKNDLSRWVIRIEFNRQSIIYKSISMEQIIEILYKHIPNSYIVYTTEQDTTVMARIYLKERMFIREVNVETFVTTTLITKLLNINIRGLPNILDTIVMPSVSYVTDTDNGYKKIEGFMIKTVGQDLRGLVSLPKEYLNDIDINNVTLNTVMDTRDLYGIESARIRIIDQLMVRMEGKHPNYHHLAIYADTITWTGDVKSIEKAVNYEKNKILAKASGYAARQVITEATFQGITELTDNIPAPIMLGTLPRFGTNYNGYLIDEEFIKENNNNALDIIMEA